MRRRLAARPVGAKLNFALLAWLLCAGAGAWAAGRNEALTTPQLLVDLARDYALSRAGQQTPADVQQVSVLLRAALRLDPQAADAYVWLYELTALSGDQAEAGKVLSGLLEAAPTHEGAFAHWLDAELRGRQTMEQRVQWLEAVAVEPRPAPLRAAAYVRLARLAVERMETAAARGLAEQALALEPADQAAAVLALQTLDGDASAAERLRATLRVLQTSPLSAEAAWPAASILDAHGFTEEAARLYEHARQAQRGGDPNAPLPGGLLLDMARNALARGRVPDAVEQTRAAIAADPSRAAEAGMFLHYLLTQQGKAGDAAVVRDQLGAWFAQLREPAQWPVNEVAQAAWFYLTLEPQPQRALMLAEAAAQRAPEDVFVRRVLGWAQAANLRPDDARRTLMPIAGRDAYAAYMEVRLLRDAGDEETARRVVEGLTPRPTCGPAFDLLNGLDASPATQSATRPTTQAETRPATQLAVRPVTQPATQPAPQLYPDVAQAWRAFDERVLEFARDPARFLAPQVELDDRSPAPGEPWWATFSLTNRGPLPITLQPDAGANPVLLVSMTVEGDQKRELPGLMTVNLDAVRVLQPGQTVRVRRTLDIGPPRRVSRLTPQQVQRVTLDVILDPERGADGQWRPGPAGQRLRPVYFNRLPAATGPEALAALFSTLSGESDAGRARAIEVLAELLGEAQRARIKPPNYQPATVPTERLAAALVNLLASESWELRVRTLDALQVAGLDRRMVDAAEACLKHDHWLVRLMALRLLARQGAAFAPRAEALAKDDPDELVRALAESYAKKWAERTSTATTRED